MNLGRIIVPVLAIVVLQIVGCSSPQKHEVAKHPLPASADTNVVLPPAWAFGVLYGGYTNQQQTIERIQKIEAHDYPIDAYWIDSWFWSFDDHGIGPEKFIDFVADTVSFPDRKAMWNFMQERHIKGGFWVWDCILKTGNEEAFNAFDEKGYFSKVYLNKNSWHNKGTSTAMFQEANKHPGTLCGNIDFNRPKAVALFKKNMKHFFEEGADFLKLDRTDKISVCKAMFEMSQEFGKETKGRGFLLSHSGGTNNDEYKRYPTKWTDDTRSDWTVEKPTKKFDPWVPRVAFKETIAMYIDSDQATSKIPFLTNDTGGFDMGKTDSPDEELYIRWLEFSMFTPITEVFSQPENPTSNLAYNYSEKADSIFRFYSHLRMQLFPYIYSYAHLTRLNGVNMIRKISDHLYEYQLGKEMLVAPVYQQGATSREVYLPEGKWYNYWIGKVADGGDSLLVDAPLNQIPLFVRQGAIIPRRNYASSIEKGTNDTLQLQLYTGSESSFSLIEDDGTSNDYLKGIYAESKLQLKDTTNADVLTIHPASGSFSGMKDQRVWQLQIRSEKPVAEINMNGKSLAFQKNGGYVVTDHFSASKHDKTTIRISY